MKKAFVITILFLNNLSFGQFKTVKKVMITRVANKKFLFFNKKVKRKYSFTEYNKSGQEIGWGVYGESSCTKYVKKTGNDSTFSVTYYHSTDYSKINFEELSFYDSFHHRLIKKETWFYHNDRKDHLSDSTLYYYNNKGKLVKERKINVIDSSRLYDAITYCYDEKGNTVKIIDSDYYNYGSSPANAHITLNSLILWVELLLQFNIQEV